MTPPQPRLITFDIFGTVVDWRRGMEESVRRRGFDFSDALFERIIDAQGAEEARGFRFYQDITVSSLTGVLGMKLAEAMAVAGEIGRWPLFEDSAEGLRRLMTLAPCAATTNSDRIHGEQTQEGIGFRLSDWICAEEARVYKPSPGMWKAASQRLRIPFGPHWWHVSAYADYDLIPARKLGLTTVFIPRPHSRAGQADVTAKSLVDLADLVEKRL